MSTHEIIIEVDDELPDEIDREAIRAAVAATLNAHDVTDASVTIVLTTDEEVHALNAQYRGVDAPTDVLSFSARETQPDAPALTLPAELAAEFDRYLGDLVIAYPYSARQAAYYGNSVTAELQLLAVHGALHLLGYDHQDAAAEAVMWAQQEQVLAQFGHGALARRTYED
ncbi:MAG TPA: rRNA maturation RNase YbeY [Chloroflexi bacterium]|nr:rRNA maturation RNase YbeY [Chloroflexota bacterium]